MPRRLQQTSHKPSGMICLFVGKEGRYATGSSVDLDVFLESYVGFRLFVEDTS